MSPHECFHLNPRIEHCGEPSIVVIDHGIEGLGACQKHIGPVLLWSMEKNERGGLPQSTRTVVPAWQWDDIYRRRNAQA